MKIKNTLVAVLALIAGLSFGLNAQTYYLTHDFDDGQLSPWYECTTQNPNYTIVENGRVKTFWTETGYNGTRMDKGAEACADFETRKEGWMGFTINLGADYPLNKTAGVAQIFQFYSSTFWTWTSLIDMENGDLTMTHRSNGGTSGNVHTVLYSDFPKETDVDIIVHFILSSANAGEIQVWIDGTSVYHVENINFGFAEGWTNDEQSSADSWVALKMGQYNFDDTNYDADETRTVYYDNVSWYDGSNGYDLVDPSPRCGGFDAFSIIEAEDYCDQLGTQSESTSDLGGGENIGYINNGDWLMYSDVDFGGGVTEIQARVSSQTSGGNIEVRLGSETGPLVGTCLVSGTGDWDNWETVTADVSGVSGIEDVYLVFTGGSGYLFNLNWVTFVNGNLALNGTASQSSTDYGGVASRAIDGDTNGAWGGSSVTHTNSETEPWWEVDLGAVSNIGDINIFNRTDSCCADRLSYFTVIVLDGSRSVTYLESFDSYPDPSITLNAGGAEGRYVRVELDASDALSLAEVEVFAGEVTNSNVALNQTVSVSGEQSGNPGSNVVDGSTGTRWSVSGFPQWLEIDLGAVKAVGQTELVCYSDRAYQFVVEAKESSGDSYSQIVDRSGNTQAGTEASPISDVFSPVNARYVRITVDGASGYTGSWVSLLEFRVIGH